MQNLTLQKQCAFPNCTNSFILLRPRKKFCCGCCRVKDFNRRKRQQETGLTEPLASKEVAKVEKEVGIAAMPMLPTTLPVAETAQKGMSMAGVGEAAVGTAGMLLLKDQLFDKAHRNQLNQQLNKLLQQQSWIYSQILSIHTKIEQFSKR